MNVVFTTDIRPLTVGATEVFGALGIQLQDPSGNLTPWTVDAATITLTPPSGSNTVLTWAGSSDSVTIAWTPPAAGQWYFRWTFEDGTGYTQFAPAQPYPFRVFA